MRAPLDTLTPWKLVITVNHPPNGWTESWHLYAGNDLDARAIAIELVEARSFLLAQGCVIEFAAIQRETVPYIHWACLDGPLTGLGHFGPVDNDWTTLLWRFDTGAGKGVPRHFRAVADDEVSGGQWVRFPFFVDPGPVPRPSNPVAATIPELYNYVLALFRDRTAHIRELPPNASGQVLYRLTPWAEVQFRRVSSYNVGGAYHRGSWEPRDYDEQPGFTPCGTVVAAFRRFYETEADFFITGPTQGIRFYRTAEGAAVFPFKTIFWGWRVAKEIPNGIIPGENKSESIVTYSLGLSWGAAPGLAPDGVELQFLGDTICPWGSSPTTPLIYRIPCDMPVAIRVNNDPQTVNDTAVTWITVDAATIDLTVVAGGHVKLAAIIPPIPAALIVDNSGGAFVATQPLVMTADFKGGLEFVQGLPAFVSIRHRRIASTIADMYGPMDDVDPGEGNVLLADSHGVSQELRSLAGGYIGRQLGLRNVGTGPVVLTMPPGIIVPSRQYFDLDEDHVLQPGEQVELEYIDLRGWVVLETLRYTQQANTAWPVKYITESNYGSTDYPNLIRQGLLEDWSDHIRVNGYLSEKSGGYVAGNVPDYTNSRWAPISGLSNATIDGVVTVAHNKFITLTHGDFLNPGPVTIKHQSGVALAAQRITCPGAVDLVLNLWESATLFGGVSGWYVIAISKLTTAPATVVASETPAGTIDGINDTFTLANSPIAGTLAVFVNGVKAPGAAYGLAGSTITFAPGSIPQPGDALDASYSY